MGAILHKEGVILSDGAMGLQPAPPPPAPTLQREWLLLGISVALLLGIVAPPLVNLGRYQHRIVADMSRSLAARSRCARSPCASCRFRRSCSPM